VHLFVNQIEIYVWIDYSLSQKKVSLADLEAANRKRGLLKESRLAVWCLFGNEHC